MMSIYTRFVCNCEDVLKEIRQQVKRVDSAKEVGVKEKQPKHHVVQIHRYDICNSSAMYRTHRMCRKEVSEEVSVRNMRWS